jgi:hypothetical protein
MKAPRALILAFIASVASIFLVASTASRGWGHFDEGRVSTPKPPARTQPKARIKMAIELLMRVPSGKEMVDRSLVSWKLESPSDLVQVIQPGPVSRTDAVLTRHYDPITGKESREREVTIYLNSEQSLTDMVLDLAHEMVHANSRPAWDPYDPNLTPARYVRSAIDGEGGEVLAVARECQVALELSRNYQVLVRRCKAYISSDQKHVEIEPIRKDFYRVGKWHPDLVKRLGSDVAQLPELSAEAPELYSSTGNAPYPVALLREYDAITKTACENSRHRLHSERSPASASRSSGGALDATALFLERRCGEAP